jgi:subtilisin family serine protease
MQSSRGWSARPNGSDHDDISPKVVERANFSDTVIRAGHPEDYDKYGHGTHVAGIVAATADNTIGVVGVCRGCTILDAKVLNDSGSGSTSRIANGINWAVSKGAKVINRSLGQRVSSRTLELADPRQMGGYRSARCQCLLDLPEPRLRSGYPEHTGGFD